MSYIGKKPVDFNDVTESQTFTVTGDLTVDTNTLYVDSTNNRVGVANASPATALDVTGTVTADELDISTGSGDATIYLQNVESARGMKITKNFNDFSANVFYSLHPNSEAGSLAFRGSQDSTQLFINSNGDISFYEDTGTTPKFFWDASAEALGIGTTSPTFNLHVAGNTFTNNITMPANGVTIGTDGLGSISGAAFQLFGTTSGNNIRAYTAGTERMRIDSSGNLLVGTTDTSWTNTDGLRYFNGGSLISTVSGGPAAYFNRRTNDGNIAVFSKDGSTVGGIVTSGGTLSIGSTSGSSAYLMFYDNSVRPATSAGNNRDNIIDLGVSAVRFNDAFITNGVTTGSDQNEKQQIASLTDAEIAAAKRISNGFKTFKWNDAVTAKGDNARTHTGVIAQEVRTALEAEGLDAGNYAFFMSDTWWETQTEVPAVEADEENGIEAADAYTRTDTYDTADEAPEGATERTRLGIRYPELLAFVGAATEQRLTHLETLEARIVALENT